MEDRKALCEQIAQLGEAGYKFIEGATAAILLMQDAETKRRAAHNDAPTDPPAEDH